MRNRVELDSEVVDFIRALAPELRRQLRAALHRLEEEKGDLKELVVFLMRKIIFGVERIYLPQRFQLYTAAKDYRPRLATVPRLSQPPEVGAEQPAS